MEFPRWARRQQFPALLEWIAATRCVFTIQCYKMNPSRWISRHRLSLAVGLVTTLLGCLAWVGGLLTRLDNFGLDLHFRYFSSIAADPRIVMIDIDDRALESVPYSFPWPRRVFADVVRKLNELGARTIVLDIVFDTADEPRQVDAALGKNYDVDTELSTMEDDFRGPPIHIYDDDELAAAMARAGNVFIPMFFRPDRSSESATIDSACMQMVTALKQNYSLDEQAFLNTGIDPERVHSYFVKAKQLAAQHLVDEYVEKNPSGLFHDFLRSVVGDKAIDTRSFEREELVRAFRRIKSLQSLRERSTTVAGDLNQRLPRAVDVTFPLAKFANSCKGVGFAGWDREAVGPIVREIPLLATLEDRLVVQLGLLAATDYLRVGTNGLEIKDSSLVVPLRDGQKSHLLMNFNAESLFNWHTDLSGNWQDSFTHIPITQLLELVNIDDAAKENDNRTRIAMGELVTLRHASTPADLMEYEKWVHWRTRHESDLRASQTPEDAQAILEQIETVNVMLKDIENEALVWLARTWQLWENQKPQNEEEIRERTKIEKFYHDLAEKELTRRLARASIQMKMNSGPLLVELQRKIKDKFCFVGYTASAQADLVATPIHPAMPGVMVHANIANTILQNRPAWRAPTSINLTCLVLLGMLVTFLSSTRGGVFAVGALVFLLMLMLFAGAYVFKHWVYHLPTIATCVTVMFVWASVTLCRQLIEERSRKRFQAALAQYTSPAIAAQIADRASAIDLAPRSAVVSCFFADLQGFTTLSEKLGPERTQRVLNPYLKAVSDVLIKHNAMVNKFMGDGIFAFFNAPIWPCKDPAAAACRSALAAQQALNELNRSTIAKEAGVPLKMRIGLSTGEVFVGDYGSDTKLDYTCIGDNVNIAGRLQAANKEFGTGILVDAQTKNAAGDQFSFRPIGDQKLTGKTQTVAVFELTGFAKPGTTIAADA